MADLLTPAQALDRILATVQPLAPVRVPLSEALGLAAAEDIRSPEPVPPFTNSAMDGFALRAADTAGASPTTPVRLAILGDLPAGQVSGTAVQAGTALRIMTGAPIPEGADAIVPVERTRSEGGWVELQQPVRPGAEIRLAGEDIPQGGPVIAAGTTLRPGEVAVLAAIGCAAVPVRPRARVAVITTGDELVDAGAPLGPGQIRDANLPALCAQLRAFGAEPLPFPRIPDTPEAVAATLREALATADVVLTTGGVSVGDYDPVKPALEALGAQCHFWKVAQKPGAPLGFWTVGPKAVFGLPGNPVAAMLMAEVYVRPALRAMMGHARCFRPERTAHLEGGWRKGRPDGRVHFLRVAVREEAGGLRATLTGPQGSGILSSILRANALALVPAEALDVPPDGPVTVQLTDLPEDH